MGRSLKESPRAPHHDSGVCEQSLRRARAWNSRTIPPALGGQGIAGSEWKAAFAVRSVIRRNHHPDSVQGFLTTKRWATDEGAVTHDDHSLTGEPRSLAVSIIGLFRSNSPKK